MYRFIYYAAPIVLLLLLTAVPLSYCIKKVTFRQGFYFTWILWAIVWFIWGIMLPAYCAIEEKATGETPDFDGGAFIIGIVAGWVPGFIFGYIGVFVRWLSIKLPVLWKK